MACNGCQIGHVEALRTFHIDKKCLEIVNNHGIADLQVKCTECDEVAKLSSDKSHWYCQSGHGFERLVRPDDLLESLYLSPAKTCLFLALYLQMDSLNLERLIQETNISSELAIRWSIFIREVFQDWCLRNSAPELGGQNIIVKMNEATFEDKYGSHSTDGTWVFSGFEKDSGNFFFEIVPDRAPLTLVRVIQRRIRPGTIIWFKSQMACGCLKEEGFNLLKEEYNVSWLDPKTNTYTLEVPRSLPENNRRNYYRSSYIADHLFRKHFSDYRDRLHHFFMAVKNFDRKNRDPVIENDVSNIDSDDVTTWVASMIFYISVCAYILFASHLFHKLLSQYDLVPFASGDLTV
ncbi:uncharacterized protein [Chelonus insularis]|uniref:uncharacterized protein n=1 Tax=Chelonus insularis TaxID=460826 RepID=UPI0015887CCD|nr:uncharacterized protein LOC118070197 [Chelonus insularis]